MSSRYLVRFERPGFMSRTFEALQEAIDYCHRIHTDADGHAEITPNITLTVYDRRSGRPAAVIAVFPEHWTDAMANVVKARIA